MLLKEPYKHAAQDVADTLVAQGKAELAVRPNGTRVLIPGGGRTPVRFHLDPRTLRAYDPLYSYHGFEARRMNVLDAVVYGWGSAVYKDGELVHVVSSDGRIRLDVPREGVDVTLDESGFHLTLTP